MNSPSPRMFLATVFAGFGLSTASQGIPAGGSQPGSSPELTLPEGEIVLRNGMSEMGFVIARDKIVVKPIGQGSQLREFPELPSNAALAAYVKGEEQLVDPEVRGLVAYPSQWVGEPTAARMITRKVAVQLREGARDMANAGLVADQFGLEHLRGEIRESSGWTVYSAVGVLEAIHLAREVAGHPSVESAHVVLGIPHQMKICDDTASIPFFPNDPYYGPGSPGRFQGYLDPPPDTDGNDGWAVHINVRAVWENARRLIPPIGDPFLSRVYLGRGVQVAIADDGLDIDHEDLTRNTFGVSHADLVNDDGDPSGGQHGTNVGGIVGAEGGNRKGLTGIAPRCDLMGISFLDLFDDDDIEQQALDYRRGIVDVHNDAWGAPDNAPIATGPGPLAAIALDRRQIYVFAGGNGGGSDDANFDGYANHTNTLSVAAINPRGAPASFNETGACHTCAGLSADGDGGQLVSTDLNNSYVDTGLEGTSYAVPFVSGVIALMLEARPDLSSRDVQEILMATGVTGLSPGGTPNGGVVSPTVANDPILGPLNVDGYSWDYSEQTGYGLVNAAEAVRLAEIWSRLPSTVVTVTGRQATNTAIGGGFTEFVFDFSERPNTRVEHATVTLTWADGSTATPADVNLICPLRPWGPGEYFSRLSPGASGVALPQVWTMSSVGHWGQMSAEGAEQGRWRVDVGNAGGRVLRSVELNLYGTPANTVPTITNADIVASGAPTVLNPRMTTDDQDLIITNIVVNDPDFNEPTIDFQWQELHPDGTTWVNMPGMSGAVTGTCSFDPVANFVVEPVTPRMLQAAQFADRSVAPGGTIVSWFWDFGDGNTSTEQNPSHTFTTPIDRTVTLTVTDDSGNTNTFGYEITVLGLTEVPPDPLPVLPVNPAGGVCRFSGTLTLPASATRSGTVYRAQLRPRDSFQEGTLFITSQVIVNSTPVTIACAGEAYSYGADLWLNNVPPGNFPPFLLLNEFSQGTLGIDVSSEWVEFMVAVGVDMRGYHLSNDIVTFDPMLTQHEVWSAIPPGTLIVFYNGDHRDAVLPPEDLDPSDGVMIVSSNNTALIKLPDNGDGWGAYSNFDPGYVVIQDEFCRNIDGLSFNGDSLFTAVGPMPDSTAAHSYAATIDGFDDPGNWFVGTAAPVPPGTALPPPVGTPGVTPGAINNTANLTVRNDVIAADLTAVPTYSLQAGAPAWLSINPTTGELTGTPTPGDAGVFPVTIVYEHSFSTETQTFNLTVKSGPPLVPTGDNDLDSIINLLETAFVTDPLTPTSPAFGLPVVGTTTVPGVPPTNHLSILFRVPSAATFDGANQTYSWTDPLGDTYLYEVQCSTDLVTWRSAADLAGGLLRDSVTPAPDNPPNVNIVTFRVLGPLPGADPLKYLRVKITHTPAP